DHWSATITKGDLLIHATEASLWRSDAHQRRFLPYENLGAGLRVCLPSIFPRREPQGREPVESVDPQSNSEPVEPGAD
ncbi:MAG: hypothetical protein O6837_10810, partial [Deltaproteobacteria bacterium]|nr:hypothetical protein [Deltaproteobacteria bacterium]